VVIPPPPGERADTPKPFRASNGAPDLRTNE
jgi:hypothetical protein